MWTVNEDKILNQCKNVYGSGYCAASSTAEDLATFTTTQTTTVTPVGFTSPTSPAWGISGYGTTEPIPVYTPAVFWSPASPAGAVATTKVADAKAVETTTAVVASSTSSSSTKSHKHKTTKTQRAVVATPFSA